MSLKTQSVPVAFAGWKALGSVPRWAHDHELNATRASLAEINQDRAEAAPGVIVLQSRGPRGIMQHREPLHELGDRLRAERTPSQIVINFEKAEFAEAETMLDIMHLIAASEIPRVEFSFTRANLKASVFEALAKYLFAAEAKNPDPLDPLNEARQVIEATRPLLHAESGRLSAPAIARAFGVSLSLIAEVIGQSKQSLNQKPDSPRAQSELRHFERIHRLRALFSEEDFLAWLSRSNSHVDDHTPHEVVFQMKRPRVIADLVEHMLLGTPS